MSTPSVQLSTRTWPIQSVQVQLGNRCPISMTEPKLRAASGSQEDPVHRRAEQEAPRGVTIPLTTEACSTFAGDVLSPSPVPPSLLLRLRQLEVIRNKASGTIPIQKENGRTSSPPGVLQVRQRGRWVGTTRSLGIPTIHGHGFPPLLRPNYGPGRHPGHRESQKDVLALCPRYCDDVLQVL